MQGAAKTCRQLVIGPGLAAIPCRPWSVSALPSTVVAERWTRREAHEGNECQLLQDRLRDRAGQGGPSLRLSGLRHEQSQNIPARMHA